jgi:carbon storage regulator
MLVLSRKIGERIEIGGGITLTVLRIHGQTVRLGIDAPSDVTVLRQELARPGAAVAGERATPASRGPRPTRAFDRQ